MAEKLDPFDIAALEKSVNDSAVRVSTIWVSYLVFGLYLVIAAGNVRHRQLLLEEPLKLPVLNIDLPLVGFFFLAPILFVIFHAYVLIQVLLLARTAAAYNTAVDRAVKPPPGNASMRQRLANTLFAQIFAGSPREREGAVGALLKLVAWTTLMATPLLVLLAFQLQFLPYHSHFVTWGHRVLIMIEAVAILLLWPLVKDPELNVMWKSVFTRPFVFISMLFLVLVAWIVAAFPGERHAGWTRYSPAAISADDSRIRATEPGRWRPQAWTPYLVSAKGLASEREPELGTPHECRTRSVLAYLLPNFDRLFLPWEDVVDDDKLTKLENATEAKGFRPYQGERTRNFRNRDFRCGTFDGADLRRVDLTDASLIGASFVEAELEGATLEGAILHRAILNGAKLHGANLVKAQLQGADMIDVQLQTANLSEAKLTGATLGRARLQVSTMIGADLRGAKLIEARLQGADLTKAKLEGARLYAADLQGARLSYTDLDQTHMYRVQLWQAAGDPMYALRDIFCDRAQIKAAVSNLALRDTDGSIRYVASEEEQPTDLEMFVELSTAGISPAAKKAAQKQLREWSTMWPASSVARQWNRCADRALSDNEFHEKWRRYLVELACEEGLGQAHVVGGLLRNFENPNYYDEWDDEKGLEIDKAKEHFARALLRVDGYHCPKADELDYGLVQHLRKLAKLQSK